MKFNETWNTMLEANPHAVARDVLHNKKGCTYIHAIRATEVIFITGEHLYPGVWV